MVHSCVAAEDDDEELANAQQASNLRPKGQKQPTRRQQRPASGQGGIKGAVSSVRTWLHLPPTPRQPPQPLALPAVRPPGRPQQRIDWSDWSERLRDVLLLLKGN